MKNILSILVVFSILVTAGGCGAPQQKEINVEIKADESFHLRVGQTVNLRFESNPTTGYLWTITDKEGYDALKRMGDYKYIPSSGRVGSGGIQIYTFEGAKRGKVTLVFEYRRPWEPLTTPAARKYTVRIDVH